MDRNFEFLAGKRNQPTDNPTRYIQAPSTFSLKPLIAIAVCIVAAVILAFVTSGQVALAFNVKALSATYFAALIAYYTGALYMIYALILLAETQRLDEFPNYKSAAIISTTMAGLTLVFGLTFPFVFADGPNTFARLKGADFHLMLPAAVAFTWLYFFVCFSVGIILHRLCQKD